MKYFSPFILFAGFAATANAVGIVSPPDGIALPPGGAFTFTFDGVPLPSPEYTSGVKVKLDLDPLGPETSVISLGSVGPQPWTGSFTIPAKVPPGSYRLIAIEQLSYSFSGLPAFTRSYNQSLFVVYTASV